MAQGNESFTEQDAGEIERMQTFTQRGVGHFATMVQGETYNELSGKLGHRAVDLSISGNGLLGYNATRVYEEIPQQYPYEMGTMSLVTPHLLIEPIVNDGPQDVLSCQDWRNSGAEVYNTIKFNHENGMVEFIPRSMLHPNIISNYPSNAAYVSKSNWYLECTGNATGTSKFLLYAPSGAVYVVNPDYGERYRTTRVQDGGPVESYTYKIYIEEKRRYNSVLTYIYEPTPPNQGSGATIAEVRPPMFLRSNPDSSLSEFQERQIFNKRRLIRVELSVADEESLEETAREKQFVYFEYRDTNDGCAGRLDRIHSATSKVKEVRYEYLALVTPDQGTVCQLTAVTNLFHDSAQTQQIWRFAYRFRDGQAFLGGAGGSNAPIYWYLPLKSVETPTATKVTYDYDVMGICQYQSVSDKNNGSTCGDYTGTNGETTSGRSGPRRPIMTKRAIADKYDAAAPNQITDIVYDNAFGTFTIKRIIIDENVSHTLTFGRPDRYSEPAGVQYESIDSYDPATQRVRFENSGRLIIYELRQRDAINPFVRVEYLHKEQQSFIKGGVLAEWDQDNTYLTGKYSYLYSQRWINPFSTVIRKEGHVYEKQYLDYDAYNNLSQLQEITRWNGAENGSPNVFRRTTTNEYDNDYTSKGPAVGNFWFVGALSKKSVQSGPAGTKDLVNSYQYNSLGLPSEAVEASFKKNFTYHNNGEVKQIINSDNVITEFKNYKRGIAQTTTNGAGETQTNLVDNFGNVTETRDGRNHITRFEYSDRYLRRTKTIYNEGVSDRIVVYPDWINTSSPNFRKQREIQGNYLREVFYDHQRNVVRVEVEDVSAPSAARITSQTFDVTNRLAFRSDPRLAAQPVEGNNYSYDPFGRIKTIAHTLDGAPLKYCYGPDCNSDPEFNGTPNVPVVDGYAIRDKAGFVSVHNYISYGAPDYSWTVELSQQIDNDEAVVTGIERNKVGFITRVSQSSSNSELSRVRTYTPYEPAESTTLLLQSELHPEFAQARTVTGFDAVGNPTTLNDFDGSAIEYVYDDAYRLRFALFLNDASDSSVNTNNVEYKYYPNGQLQELIHGGSTWRYDYDSNNQLISESLSIDDLPNSFDFIYTYDNLMYLNQILYPSGRVVDYNHNAFGETVRVQGYVSTANYHASGNLANAQLENGQAFTSSQDTKQRPNEWEMTGFNNSLALDMTYLYDVRDNVSRINGYFNSGTPLSLTALSYDGLSRLQQADGEWSEGTTSLATYEYNALGDITSKALDGSALTYAYTPTTGTLAAVIAPPGEPLNSRSFLYDGRGNVTANGQDSFKFNQLNQLVEVEVTEEPGSTGFKYIYDGNAMRVKTITTAYDDLFEGAVDTGATYHVYTQGGQLLYEVEVGSGETRDHIFFNGNRIATRLTHNQFDTDADGMPDYYERLHGLDPTNASDADGDADMDTLSNLFEYQNNLIPSNSDSDFDGISDPNDPDTPQPPMEQGAIAMLFGLETNPVSTVTTDEELTVSFALVESQGFDVSVNALELWILSSDGSDLVKVQSPDLPSGVFSMQAEGFQDFSVDIIIEDYELSIGDYFVELRVIDADNQTYLPEKFDGAVNPVSFTVENAPAPPPVANNVNIEPIISFFLD